MWSDSKRHAFRERLLLTAPEVNPHEFVRRYLLTHTESRRGSTEQPIASVKPRALSPKARS